MSQSEIERLREINAELLDACKEALSCIKGWSLYGPFRTKLEAAIAKAEGRST